MMKRKNVFCIILVIFFYFCLTAQNIQPPSNKAVNDVQSICNILHIPFIPVYSSFSVQNACTTVINGNVVILYNPKFLEYIASAGFGGPIYVFAHEIGHVANFDLSWYGNFTHPWTKELRADYIGGYVLAKMGYSSDEALNVHKYVLFTMYNTQNYPNSMIRMDAIIAGYNYGLIN